MAWHILHSLLEQVRIHSTFSGKLWIVMMFIFRIVVVARIGDMVYHDEQHNFICNTLTPGCSNVCFNQFSPISQLRYWSLMVLTVSAPGILFGIFAYHKISHAFAKYPEGHNEDEEESPPPYNPPAGSKRKRMKTTPMSNPSAPPLYVVKRISSKREEKSDRGSEKKNGKNPPKYQDEEKNGLDRRRGSLSENVFASVDDLRQRRWRFADHQPRNGFPVYDRRGRQIDYVEEPPSRTALEQARKKSKSVLKVPQMYTAYWWHVVIRTLLEIGFLLGQYYLYGFYVPELFECTRWPCVKTVDCFVSRPMEKTCLMYLMFSLGAISCGLSVGEFCTLGWKKFVVACCCRGEKQTYEEKRRLLAEVKRAEHSGHHGHNPDHPKVYQKPSRDEILMMQHSKFTSKLSLESLSSETTVESV